MGKAERRKHPRVEMRVLLDLYVFGALVSQGRGCVTDLSLGGLRLETEIDFEVDTPLNLRFPMSEEIPLDFMGEIIWKKPGPPGYIYGIKFTDLHFGSKRQLQKYIVARLEK